MSLFDALAAYARLHEPWLDAVEALEAASACGKSSAGEGGSSPIAVSVDGLVGTDRTEPLLSALRPCMSTMSWRQNPTYTDESFLARYAYCELLGPVGLMPHATISVGLLFLAPGTRYPPHAHPAEEAYHLLAGVSEWQAGAAPLTWRSPGDRMEHPGGVSHAMRSGTTPMLALYVWRGDLTTPSRFLPCDSA